MEKRYALELLKGDPDCYRHAIKFVMAGNKLYEKMATKEPNSATSRILLTLADNNKTRPSLC